MNIAAVIYLASGFAVFYFFIYLLDRYWLED